MSKNWKKLLMGLALCAGMITWTSCNDDVTDEGGGNGGNGNEVTETGYFSINLRGGIMTRADDDNIDEGTADEQKISEIHVVLYDDETQEVAYSWKLNAENSGTEFAGSDVVNGGGNPNSAVGDPSKFNFRMNAQKVLKKKYQMVVLANPEPIVGPEILEKGTPLARLQEAVTLHVEEEDFWKTPIFMSNARGLIPIEEGDLYPEAVEAEEHAVPAEIDRGCAKVILYFGTDLDMDRVGSETAAWEVDIINKKMYPLRKQTLTSNYEKESMAREADQTPRYELYAEDPNFDGFSNREGSGKDLREEFLYLDDIEKISRTINLSNVDLNNAHYAYVTENTMAEEEQWEDVTTRIVAKINYVPKATENVSIGLGESYFYYKGYAISTEQMSDLATLIWNGSQYELPVELNGLDEIIYNLNGNPTYPLKSFATESWNYENQLAYYYEGISYYSILIRHFNDQQQPNDMKYGRYGVVRNNIYKVSINSISAPGSIDIPDPEGQDDKEKGYISADITVQPWYVREQGVEL